MAKESVSDFDQSICNGSHPDVSGVCPHRKRKDEETGRDVIDTLARLESEAIEAVTGDEQFKCGMCGCPLANLELVNEAPAGCPRLALHDE